MVGLLEIVSTYTVQSLTLFIGDLACDPVTSKLNRINFTEEKNQS